MPNSTQVTRRTRTEIAGGPSHVGEHYVVVGVNETPIDLAVVDWATREAASRNVALRIVTPFRWAPRSAWAARFDLRAFEIDALRKRARTLVDQLAQRAHVLAPELPVATAAVEGDPVDVLWTEARKADLAVVGRRDVRSLRSPLPNLFATQVAARTASPVVVVCGVTPNRADRAEVVVGLDRDEGAHALLAFAADHARRHGCAVRAVLCRGPGRLRGLRGRREREAAAEAERWLAEVVAGWQRGPGDVDVRTTVARSHPARGLIECSKRAELLVIGRQSHAFRGLGPTARSVLRRADVPVAVVPL